MNFISNTLIVGQTYSKCKNTPADSFATESMHGEHNYQRMQTYQNSRRKISHRAIDSIMFKYYLLRPLPYA